MIKFHHISPKTSRIVLQDERATPIAEATVWQGDLIGEGYFEITEHRVLTPDQREVLEHAANVAAGSYEAA